MNDCGMIGEIAVNQPMEIITVAENGLNSLVRSSSKFLPLQQAEHCVENNGC